MNTKVKDGGSRKSDSGLLMKLACQVLPNPASLLVPYYLIIITYLN